MDRYVHGYYSADDVITLDVVGSDYEIELDSLYPGANGTTVYANGEVIGFRVRSQGFDDVMTTPEYLSNINFGNTLAK
jgi:hypothetical protein